MIEDFHIDNCRVVPLSRWEHETGVGITKKCTGKMKFMWGISTSSTVNPLCMQMSKNKELVCSHCYSRQFLAYRKTAKEKFERNFKLLTSKVFDIVPDIESEMFFLSRKMFRIEMYGDIYNEKQTLNYLLMAIFNPGVSFGWWTKHIGLVESVLSKTNLSIPDNLSIVESSPRLNVVKECKNKNIVNHVFTVYDYEYAEKNEIDINCAARSCFDCGQCYHQKGKFYINEVLKNAGRIIKHREN